MPIAQRISPNFFNGKNAIEQIRRDQQLPSLEPTVQDRETLMGSVYSVFTKTIGDLFLYFSLDELGNRFLLMAKWAELRPDSYYRSIFGDRFLVRAVNLPPIDQVNHLDDSIEGGCLGSSEWMLSLYFRTAHLFSNARDQLIAIAKLFRRGLPVEAQVLQTYDNDEQTHNPHLGLSKRVYVEIANRGTFEEKLEKVVCSMVVAPLGAYTIHLPGHRITWFKTSKTTSYIHDQNSGLIELRSIKNYIQISNIMLATYQNAFATKALTIRSVTPFRLK